MTSEASPAAPGVAAGTELEWLVCHTRPRCEKKFAALMAAEGFAHYLALIESIRRYHQQTKHFTKPLFPGYVFAQVPQTRKTRIYQQDLLARAIVVEDESRFLRQLEDVKTIVNSGLELAVQPLLTKGRRVRVVGGPLHGVEGYVDNPANPKGIVVAIDVLRQGLLITMPLESLQPLP
jgi:transcription antitermination factor NusG